MPKYDLARLMKQLRIDEGVKYKAYLCPAGHWTCGVGHNLEAHPDPEFPPRATTTCTPEQADKWLLDDIREAEAAMLRHWPWMKDLPPDVYEALLNLVFNMGAGTFSQFVNTLKALRDHDFDAAAHHLEQSHWYVQVGARAKRVVSMVRNGGKNGL